MSIKPKILLIEDDEAARFSFVRFLSRSGFEIIEAEDLLAANRRLAKQTFDAVILDIILPDGSGMDLIEEIRQDTPGAAIIIVTGVGDIPLAVEAMRRGADNFLTKPVELQSLEIYLKKILELRKICKVHSAKQRVVPYNMTWFGESAAIQEVISLAETAAETDLPILITGETGTGKGVLARWIHEKSQRASFSFIDLNCSGFQENLLACELFGNVRGAFTSADRDRTGLLDAADGGSLFLDEIGEMDVIVQSQFLKVLEDKTFRRVGDTKPRRSDFRLICATNKQIEQEVAQGSFRKDLYFRINLLNITIPPLRERLEDLPQLIRHLLNMGKSSEWQVTKEAMNILQRYDWPGNIRELKNVLERAKILSRTGVLDQEHFSWLSKNSFPQMSRHHLTLDEMERGHISTTLEKNQGDVSATARQLGISRATLYRKLKDMDRKN